MVADKLLIDKVLLLKRSFCCDYFSDSLVNEKIVNSYIISMCYSSIMLLS